MIYRILIAYWKIRLFFARGRLQALVTKNEILNAQLKESIENMRRK